MKYGVGLLLIRLGFGGTMALVHGWDKMMNFTERMGVFPDPLHVGSSFSLALAVFAELFCSLFVVLGLATRFAVVPLIITMAVAFFIIHGEDPFMKRELSLMYMMAFIGLFFTGAGPFSLDSFILKKN